MSATCGTGQGGTHLLGRRSRAGRGRLHARVPPSPSRAGTRGPESRAGLPGARSRPPGLVKGRKRRRVGEGHCPHVRSGPAPHCPGGGTLRGPGAGGPPGRAVAPPLARVLPSSFAGGRPAPGTEPRAPRRAVPRGHSATRSPFPLGLWAPPKSQTPLAGGWVGWQETVPRRGSRGCKAGESGRRGKPRCPCQRPRFERGKPERVSSAGGSHSSVGRGQRGRRASFRRQVGDCTVAQAGRPVREGSTRGVVTGGSEQVTSWQKAREKEAARGDGVGRSRGRGAVWTETPYEAGWRRRLVGGSEVREPTRGSPEFRGCI